MSGELEVPWQESFALYPEKRDQLVGSLLPSDNDFFFYSIVLSLSRLGPGDPLPKETQELLDGYKKKCNSQRYKQLKARCDLIEMQSKETSPERLSVLRNQFRNQTGVSLSHEPPHVEGKEMEQKYGSVMKMRGRSEWEEVARNHTKSVCSCFFFLSSLFSSLFSFLFSLSSLFSLFSFLFSLFSFLFSLFSFLSLLSFLSPLSSFSFLFLLSFLSSLFSLLSFPLFPFLF